MSNPLTNLFNQAPQQNNILKNIENIKQVGSTLKNGNPEQIAMHMMQQNPQFRKFVNENKGKTPEQIARENGLDWKAIIGQFK